MLPPAPVGRVNDYAGVLASGERERLERTLAARERETGAQVVVAAFRSLEGESLEDVSLRLGERWKLGRRGRDDGALLVVFVAERRARLEVGYGLEPSVPDSVAATILRETLAPALRQGRWADGLAAAALAVHDRVARGRAVESSRGGREPTAVSSGTSPAVSSATSQARRGPAGRLLSVKDLAVLAVVALVATVLWHEVFSTRASVRRRQWSLGPRGWRAPVVLAPRPWGGGFFGGWGGGGGGGGFSGGGGSFGGGGASGEW